MTNSIQARVNEDKMLAFMQHFFQSPLSVLGELMQNARRAGATGVKFVFDQKANSLTITDDGCGIKDYQALLSLADSGWDETVKAKDNPFGMGFFSLFYACDTVLIESNDYSLAVGLDDIKSRRTLTPEAMKTLPGTRIVMQGLKPELVNTGNYSLEPGSAIKYELVHLARGFPIDVRYNGEELSRNQAKETLTGIEDACGFFSFDWEVLGASRNKLTFSLFLQGLPIETKYGGARDVVVHLSNAFTPVLPDRKCLYDAPEALARIEAAALRMLKEHLLKEKARLDAQTFLEEYYWICLRVAPEMLNDIPLLPNSRVGRVVVVYYDTQYRHEAGYSTLEELKGAGAVRNAPDNVCDEGGDGAILKVLHRRQIAVVKTQGLDKGHWVFSLPSCGDLEVLIEHGEELGESSVYPGNFRMDVKLVSQITVTLTSTQDPSFVVKEVIENDWVIDVLDDTGGALVCYVTPTDESKTYPVCAVTGFTDEYDSYHEEWEDAATAEWIAALAGMKKLSLTAVLSDQIKSIGLPLFEHHVGNLTLVAGVQKSNHIGLAVFDLESADFWDRIAKRIVGLDSKELKAAFVAEVTSAV